MKFTTISATFDEADFHDGESDGSNGAPNKNVGSVTPSASYQMGYYLGIKKHLLREQNIFTNHDRYELIVEYPYPGAPLSSPPKFTIHSLHPPITQKGEP